MKSEDMEIRPYRPDDLDETVRLWYRTWHHTFPELRHPQTFDQWRLRFRDEISATEQVWVAEVNGRIVGFLAVKQAAGYLHQLFVDPEWQRQGIGTALMTKAKALAPEGLSLHTLEQNAEARAFWENHGFRPGRTGINPINEQRNIEYRWEPWDKPGATLP